MNRMRAGDAWARVSAERYGFRLDGDEARIEISSLSLSLFLSLSFLHVHTKCLPRHLCRPVPAPFCGITVASFVPFDYLDTMRERLDTRNRGNADFFPSCLRSAAVTGANKHVKDEQRARARFLSSIIIRRATYNLILPVSFVTPAT